MGKGKDRGIYLVPGTKERWGIRWMENGRERRKVIGTKGQALAARDLLRSRRLEGKFLPARPKNVLIEDAIRSHVETIRPTSRSMPGHERHARLWSEYFSGRSMASITAGEVEAWRVQQLKAGYKPATVNRATAFLRRVFYVAMRNGLADHNPVAQLRQLRENNEREWFLTAEERDRLVGAMDSVFRSHVVMALYTGLRISAMLALEWTDVNFRSNTIRIKVGKHGEREFLPIFQELRPTLEALPSRKKSRWLFPNADGTAPVSQFGGLRGAFERARKVAGLEGLRWHDLRHSFASMLAEAGVPLYTIQKLMGQKTPRMAERYAHLSASHLQDAVDRLPALPNPGNVPAENRQVPKSKRAVRRSTSGRRRAAPRT